MDAIQASIDPGLLTACVATGLCAGFLGGLLGIGGGAIIVPALIAIFASTDIAPGLQSTMAVGTSLATIVFTSAAAASAQLKRGAIHWDIVRTWTPGLLIGSFASAYIARHLPEGALALFIGVFFGAVAVILLIRWRPAPHRQLPARAGSLTLATVAGTVSGLAGIGGGNVIVPTLLFYNVEAQRAAATSSTLGVPISLFGTLGYVSAGLSVQARPPLALGYVYVPAVVAIAAATMLMAPLGVALAHRISGGLLQRIFGLLLMLASARILVGAL